MSLGKISVELRAVVGKFINDFSAASKEVESFSSKLDKIAGASGVASAGLAAIGVFAAKAASDFEQTGSLIGRAFGPDRVQDIESFASKLSGDLGTSLQETRQGLVSVGMQLKNSLGDVAAAEKQSKAITQLAADISAAMNVPFADTLERIQSGLRGETESIEKLNIFIGENALKTEAMNQGLTQSVTTMDEAQKTALRLAAIYRQTADVQGAAASEAGTFAGQLSRLDADVKNAGRELGEVLLPAALEIVKAFRAVVAIFRDSSPEMKKLMVAAGATVAALGALLFAVNSVAGALATVGPIATVAATAFRGVAASAIQAAAGAGAANIMVADWALALINLAKVAGVAAVAVGTFTASYMATSAVLEAMGLRTVPKNVSVWSELVTAFEMAKGSARGLLRVLVNLASAIAALGATSILISSLGVIDLRAQVDQVNEFAQGLIDESEAAELSAAAADQLTAADRALLAETVDLSKATDGLGNVMQGTDAPLAGTAAATAFLKKKQDAATKAAEVFTSAIKEQRDAVRDLEDAFASLSDRTGVAGLEGAAFKARDEATARARKVGGEESQSILASEMSLIADNFGLELVKLLENIDTKQFADAVEKGRAAAAGLGLDFEKLVAASSELQERFANSGKTSAEVIQAAAAEASARKEFAAQLIALRSEVADFSAVFPGFAAVVAGANDKIEALQNAAEDGRVSVDRYNEALDLVRQASTEQIAEILRSAEGTADFSEAMKEARAAARRLGIEFSEVEKAAKRRRGFDRTEAAPGQSFGDSAARSVFGALDGLGEGVAKAVGQNVGGGIDAAIAGSLDLSGFASIVGSLGGALAGISPQMGAQIGEAVAGVLETVLAPAIASFSAIGDAIGALILSDPRLASAGDQVGAVVSSFSGLGVLLATVLVPTVVALGVALTALAVPITLLGLAFGGLAVIAGTIVAAVAVVVGAVVGLVGYLVALGSAAIGLTAIISSAALALTGFLAAPVVFAAVTAAVFSLVQSTKEFARAQAIVTGVVDNVVRALEPLGSQFVVLAQLFKTASEIFLPFIQVFAEGDAVGRLLFFSLKQAALMGGTFALATAGAINLIAAAVGAFASFMAGLFETLRGPLEAIGLPIDDLVEGFEAAADAAGQLGNIDTKAITDALEEVASTSYDSAKEQAHADMIRDKKDRLRAIMDERNARKEQETTDATTGSFDQMREALRNVTSDFKVAYARFQAADAIVPPGSGGVGGGRDQARPRSVIEIGNMTVVANDPEVFFEKLRRIQDRANLEASGQVDGRLPPRPRRRE